MVNLLKGLNIKGKILYNEPLSRHTTFKIGGRAKIWAVAEDLDSLTGLLETARLEGLPVFLFGEGSNLLVSDRNLEMMAISLKGDFCLLRMAKGRIACGAGYNLQRFILNILELGRDGLEFMAGIPGTVGGAIKMNAGAGINGPWISDFVEGLTCVNPEGKIVHAGKRDLKFGYRESDIKDFIIVEADFNLKQSKDKNGSLDSYLKFLAQKKGKQELSVPSAGCVFKNPRGIGISAARLIEECGLKGRKMGGATVSTRHANFIVNTGKAKFRDVMNLIELIKKEVKNKCKADLETEIEIIDPK